MTYTFRLPIGDWSGDGHGKCDWFVVNSNKPVEAVREAHFKGCAEVLDLHAILSEYGESHVHLKDIPEWAHGYFNKAGAPASFSSVASLWLEVLQRADPELILTLEDRDNDMLPFYGFDEKNRHISYVGYGLFD